jgi:hypothetical protein
MQTLALTDTRPAPDPDFQLQVGPVLSRSFSVWLRHFFPFMLMAVIFYAPMALYLGLLLVVGASPEAFKAFSLVERLFSIILGLALSGAVTYGVFQHLRGQPADTGDILRAGLRHLFPVWGVSIYAGILTGIGLILLIVPGLMLMCRYYVAVPVAVVEDPGASNALSRSTELTEGSRWPIFGLVLILGVISIGTALLGGFVLAIFAEGTATGRAEALQEVAVTVLTLPAAVLQAVAAAVAYHDLRIGREGADVEELVKVFD